MRIAPLLLAALPAVALAEPMTLKGLAPGMTKAQLSEVHPTIDQKCMRPERDTTTDEICGYSTKYHGSIPALHTFAGVNVDLWTIMLKAGVVHTVTITLPSDDFDRVEIALTERWGKPNARTTDTVSNRMGASFDQVKVNWAREGFVLRAMKRSGKVTQAMISLTTERGMEERYKANKDAAKAAASDM